MRTTTPILLLVPVLALPLLCLSPAPATASPAPREAGFWMEFKLGAQLGFPGDSMLVSPSPGFVLGYRTGRFLLGAEVGGQWMRSQYASPDPTYSQEVNAFTVKAMPVLQVDLVRVDRLRLYLTAAAGLSYTVYDLSGGTRYRDRGLGLVADLGLGLRYFLTPRFAVGAEAAATGTYYRGELLLNGDTGATRSFGVGVRGALTVALLL